MSLMQCRTPTTLELSWTRRSADDRYYYETPEFDSAHAECSYTVQLELWYCQSKFYMIRIGILDHFSFCVLDLDLMTFIYELETVFP